MKRKLLTSLLIGACSLIMFTQSALGLSLSYNSHSHDGKGVSFIAGFPELGTGDPPRDFASFGLEYRTIDPEGTWRDVNFSVGTCLSTQDKIYIISTNLDDDGARNQFRLYLRGWYCDGGPQGPTYCDWGSKIPGSETSAVEVVAPQVTPVVTGHQFVNNMNWILLWFQGRGDEFAIQLSDDPDPLSTNWATVETLTRSSIYDPLGSAYIACSTDHLSSFPNEPQPLYARVKSVDGGFTRYSNVRTIVPVVPVSQLAVGYANHFDDQESVRLQVTIPGWDLNTAQLQQRTLDPVGDWTAVYPSELPNQSGNSRTIQAWLNNSGSRNEFRLINANGDATPSLEVVTSQHFDWEVTGFNASGYADVFFFYRACNHDRWIELAPSPEGPWTRQDKLWENPIYEPLGSAMTSCRIPNHTTIPLYARLAIYHYGPGTTYSDVYTVFAQPTNMVGELNNATIDSENNVVILDGVHNADSGSLYSSTNLVDWTYETHVGHSPYGPPLYTGPYELPLNTNAPVTYYKMVLGHPIPEAGGRYYSYESNIIGAQIASASDVFSIQSFLPDYNGAEIIYTYIGGSNTTIETASSPTGPWQPAQILMDAPSGGGSRVISCRMTYGPLYTRLKSLSDDNMIHLYPQTVLTAPAGDYGGLTSATVDLPNNRILMYGDYNTEVSWIETSPDMVNWTWALTVSYYGGSDTDGEYEIPYDQNVNYVRMGISGPCQETYNFWYSQYDDIFELTH